MVADGKFKCNLKYEDPYGEVVACKHDKHRGNSGRCIFHAPIEEKTPEEFWPEFDRYVEIFQSVYNKANEETQEQFFLDCSYFVFPDTGEKFKSNVFKIPLDFSNAAFSGKADFFKTRFKKYVRFSNTKFSGQANFVLAVFFQGVEFTYSEFSRDADFSHTIFVETADFSSSYFSGRVNFAVIVNNPEGKKIGYHDPAEVWFTEVALGGKSELIISRSDLGNWAFFGTTGITKAHFLNVTWTGLGKPKRNHTKDEELLDKYFLSPEDIGDVYRRLRFNYENNLAYGTAGAFFVGQMIMYRKQLFRNRNFLRWGFSWLYNLFSRYGESIWLPLTWLGGLFAVAALSYWLSGQTTGEALRSSFLGFVSLKIRLYEGVTGWLVPSLQRIFGIPIITLFILALRRAFRR